jgi:hypothetical protein
MSIKAINCRDTGKNKEIDDVGYDSNPSPARRCDFKL